MALIHPDSQFQDESCQPLSRLSALHHSNIFLHAEGFLLLQAAPRSESALGCSQRSQRSQRSREDGKYPNMTIVSIDNLLLHSHLDRRNDHTDIVVSYTLAGPLLVMTLSKDLSVTS